MKTFFCCVIGLRSMVWESHGEKECAEKGHETTKNKTKTTKNSINNIL